MNVSCQFQRCVVTGSSGFIAQRLCDSLESSGVQVTRMDRSQVDLCDTQATKRAFEGLDAQVVFHLAAAGVHPSAAHDAAVIGLNTQMVANVVHAVPAQTTLVLAGSMSEYGIAGVLSESMPCDPQTAYGIAKVAANQYAMLYGAKLDLRIRIARLFGVYGPGEAPHRLFPALLRALSNGDSVSLSDGLQRRDFIHVDDVCEGLVRLANLEKAESITVNMGTGSAVSIREVGQWMADGLNADPGLLQFGARERSPGDADLMQADVRKLRALLDWVPAQRLSAGMDVAQLLMTANS